MQLKSYIAVATVLLACPKSINALALAAKDAPAAQETQVENFVQQDKTFKMSPQDKTFGANKLDGTDKFSKSGKNAAAPENPEDKTPSSGGQVTNDENDPVILDDYDPNRLGVSAEDAAAGSPDPKSPKSPKKDQKKENTQDRNDEDSEESTPNTSDPKSGLSSGKGEGSGGVGAGRNGESDKPSVDELNSNKTPKNGATKTEEKSSEKDDKHVPKVDGAHPISSSAPAASAQPSSAHADAHADAPVTPPKTDSKSEENEKSDNFINTPEDTTLIGSLHHFFAATGMIVFAEIGDKTFFIAALMAMRHPAFFVFSASFSSLAIMTLLSAFLGMLLPSLLSVNVTNIMAAGLFLIFGVKLLKEGLSMDANTGAQEEMHEVEHELEMNEANSAQDMAEKGNMKSTQSTDSLNGLKNLANLVFSPVWVQIFIMTFLGEWGDRSQIATVAMAAGSHYWQIICGALLGHCACTILAVYGGKLLATRISMRTITLGGAASFLLFAVLYLIDGLNGEPAAVEN